jgi:hypothetical protein
LEAFGTGEVYFGDTTSAGCSFVDDGFSAPPEGEAFTSAGLGDLSFGDGDLVSAGSLRRGKEAALGRGLLFGEDESGPADDSGTAAVLSSPRLTSFAPEDGSLGAHGGPAAPDRRFWEVRAFLPVGAFLEALLLGVRGETSGSGVAPALAVMGRPGIARSSPLNPLGDR